MLRLRFVLPGLLLLVSTWSLAETGAEGWLRYAPIADARVIEQYHTLPGSVFSLNDSPIVRSAESELVRGIGGMLGRKLKIETDLPDESAFVLGTVTELQARFPHWKPA
ncbi:MAG TPA: alpha-glucuronidase family glycosyl hydrolase, partial [Silvibacterium sp.]|nr:alpha-glucuronidase family glycosyl hydrolase [Silvibacterium sp.]